MGERDVERNLGRQRKKMKENFRERDRGKKRYSERDTNETCKERESKNTNLYL